MGQIQYLYKYFLLPIFWEISESGQDKSRIEWSNAGQKAEGWTHWIYISFYKSANQWLLFRKPPLP